jgi:hypothetical protein
MLKPSDKGAIAETAITAAAVQLGVRVWIPVQEGGRYDLIFGIGEQLLRIQCKWGRRARDVIIARTSTCRHTPCGPLTTTYSADEVDAIAVHCAELKRSFYLPIERVAGLSVVHLRIVPARNNQKALVNMADDYDLDKMVARLGAVAQLGERRAGSAKVRGSSPLSSTPQAAQSRGLFAV